MLLMYILNDLIIIGRRLIARIFFASFVFLLFFYKSATLTVLLKYALFFILLNTQQYSNTITSHNFFRATVYLLNAGKYMSWAEVIKMPLFMSYQGGWLRFVR